ncbi:MAG TPA: BlaI/MecI/CopY family transcriptional regulator [Mucilaginibacter sp.]|nr:BlaI/MecI/CopY family transcriptional regulator [Mucilaginibacter sp.]
MEKDSEIKKAEPTRGELDILQVLWETGPATVRAVNDALLRQKEVNYTTTLKQMQVMAEKGLLLCDKRQVKHIYRVAEDEQKTKAHLLKKITDGMFRGSIRNIVVQLLGNGNPSKEDIREIKAILEQLEKETDQ